jgi:hypothetical protein
MGACLGVLYIEGKYFYSFFLGCLSKDPWSKIISKTQVQICDHYHTGAGVRSIHMIKSTSAG